MRVPQWPPLLHQKHQRRRKKRSTALAGVAKWCCCCKLRQLERNVGEKERKIDERGEERKKVQRKTNCEEEAERKQTGLARSS